MDSLEEFFNKYYNNNIGRCHSRNFHLDLIYGQEIRKLCKHDDWRQFGFVINLIPNERKDALIELLKVGFLLKEAHDLLKETYKF